MRNLSPAVFLDRDGTIIDDRGYISHPEDAVFYPETIPSLKLLQEHFRLFIVTNQSGVAKGLIDMSDVERVNGHIISHLTESGIHITDTFVCPHNREDDCLCIKPKPYFLEKARAEHNINISDSFVIGDHPHDVDFGVSAGARSVYLLSGHGERHRGELKTDTVIARGIGEAAEYILGQAKY